MTLSIPKWLDEKFIQSCLEDGKENEEVNIMSYDTSSLVPPGYNFLSLLIRVKVKYQQTSIEGVQHSTIVVKAPPGATSSFYETEPKFYRIFMPAATEISPNDRFVPKAYFSSLPGVVVMEDLNSVEYSMAEKRELLDYDHCRFYAIAAAKFHAVSVAVYNKYPAIVESLGSEKFFSNEDISLSGMKRLYVGGLRHMAHKMKDLEEYKKYADIILSSSTTLWDMMVEALKPNATFNTLTQGDPWTANMMFKYDKSGKVVDIKLLDFQGLRYSSPVADLIFFTWTSPKHEVRENRLEEFYHVYCDTLNENLKNYNCIERLSYGQLMEGVKNLSCKALFIASTALPVIMCKKPLDMTAIFFGKCDEDGLNQAFEQFYDSDYCEHHLLKMLKQLDATRVFKSAVTQLGMEAN